MDTQSTGTWISVADAAILLKVKPATVLHRIEKGMIPARRPNDMPFTYDGKENYEIRLDALPQRLQYQYLYTHLPESDICSLDCSPYCSGMSARQAGQAPYQYPPERPARYRSRRYAAATFSPRTISARPSG